MRLDLHVHTTASDGSLEPGEVVRAAATGGLGLIAITDHDTTAGFPEAERVAKESGVRVVPAVEVSTTHDGHDVHVLGYFVDPFSPALLAHRKRAVTLRRARMQSIVSHLRKAGCGVGMEAVLAAAGPGHRMLARPHLATALVRAGYARSVGDAFHRYIGDHCPAFVPTDLLDPQQGIELILASGGAPVWAHPPDDLLRPLLPVLIEAGLVGLEVYRPGVPPARLRSLLQHARATGLLVTGGSDWHGHDRNGPLGAFYLDEDLVRPLLAFGVQRPVDPTVDRG